MDIANRQAHLVRGITLLELITTLAVAGVSLAIIVPGWSALSQRSQLTSGANLVLTHLRYARTEAVTRGETVTLCPSDDGSSCSGDPFGWHRGYIVFVDADGDRDRASHLDEKLLRTQGAAPTGLRLHTSAGRPAVRFRPDGTAGGTNATFRLCLGDEGRAVVLYGSGRARVDQRAPGNRAVTCNPG